MILDQSTVSSAYAARADLPDRDSLPARIGRYVPIRRLGQGGMGIVYEAVDPSLSRRVAVKVLHRGRQRDGEEVRARRRRLLREAQAMARLSHPNVLPVYDVGESGTDVFLAMELVAGCSLAEWLADGERGWRAIVTVFAAAGRGLAAAHAAGVVHRDFKPGNVLVGVEGSVRVVDFGLARSAGSSAPDTEPGPELADRADPAGTPPPDPLTVVGAVLGTPAYMSPEQRRGGIADARSDQYSFCISLWQALGGKLTGTPPEPTRGGAGGAPRRLRRALLKGLEPDPRARHASMDDLLRELDRLLLRRRRWLAAASGLGVVAIVAGTVLAGRAEDDAAMCSNAGRRLAGVWDPAARRALQESFAASGHPAAAATVGRVEARLDDYSRGWVAMRTEACEATRVHGEQSEGLLDLRMQCLDRRLSQLDALVTVLAEHPGSDEVAGAVAAAWRLEPVDGCADAQTLAQRVPLPADPSRRTRVIELRARLDRAAALLHAGRYAAGQEVAGHVVSAAQRLGYAPLRAEALLLHGVLLDMAGESAESEQVLRAAASAAAEAEDDERLANAWVELVYNIGMSQARHGEALQLAELASTAAVRARSGRVRGMLEHHVGVVSAAIGRYPEAERRFRRAAQLREAALGAGHPDTASSLNALGATLASLGKLDEAQGLQDRVLGLRRAAFGDDHPIVAHSLTSLARLASLRGDQDEAARHEERALALRERFLGPEHSEVGISLSNLGAYDAARGDHAGAVVRYERALAVFTAALPPDHPFTSRVLTGLGEEYVHVGRAAEAIAPLERALAIKQKLEDPLELAHSEYSLALAVEAASHDRRRARELMTRARDNYALAKSDLRRLAVEWLDKHQR